LAKSSDESSAAFETAQAVAVTEGIVQLTGQVDNYMGRWPSVLEKQPSKPRRVIVTRVDIIE
jgi:hypothetical protein